MRGQTEPLGSALVPGFATQAVPLATRMGPARNGPKRHWPLYGPRLAPRSPPYVASFLSRPEAYELLDGATLDRGRPWLNGNGTVRQHPSLTHPRTVQGSTVPLTVGSKLRLCTLPACLSWSGGHTLHKGAPINVYYLMYCYVSRELVALQQPPKGFDTLNR